MMDKIASIENTNIQVQLAMNISDSREFNKTRKE